MERVAVQNLWRTKVVLYVFLEGAGAGCYFVAILADLWGGQLSLFARPGLVLGLVLVASGTVFLWLDLGKKSRFYRALANPKTSWIARGVLMVALFLALGAVYYLSTLWPWAWLNNLYPLKLAWGGFSALLALAIPIYPGLLLMNLKPFKLWDNPLIMLLFLILSLLGGIAVLLLTSFVMSLGMGTTSEILGAIRSALGICQGLLLAGVAVFAVYLPLVYLSSISGRESVLGVMAAKLLSRLMLAVSIGLILPLLLTAVASSAQGMSLVVISVTISISLLVGSWLTRYMLFVTAVREVIPVPGPV